MVKVLEKRRVVVTGLGTINALGLNVDQFWSGLHARQSGVGIIEFPPRYLGALVCNFSPEDYLDAKEIRRLSKVSQFALASTMEALTNAQITPEQLIQANCGVILGCTIAGFMEAEPYFSKYSLEQWKGNPLIIHRTMNNAPASNISIKYGLDGPLFTTDAGCASSAHAIGAGFQHIRSGQSDAMIVGGVDSTFSPGVMQAWSRMGVLSTQMSEPGSACKPFSLDRDGLVLGEGAGIVLLESENHALARGAPILAEIKGYGAHSDGFHIVDQNASGAAKSMNAAVEDASLSLSEIDYINAHGTGTLLNDRNETNAIKMAFGTHSHHIPVSSIKGAVGHCMGAAAALEFISVVLSIVNQEIPATINYSIRDPDLDLDYVSDGPRKCKIINALSNSFALGGSNGVLAIGRY